MSNVDGLASEWLEVKAQEKEIIAKRHAIEEQITKALDAKGEGSISHKLEQHKVTLTQPVSRKVDPIVWEKLKTNFLNTCVLLRKLFLLTRRVVVTCWRKSHGSGRKVSKAFETKQGKIGVKVEEL